MELLYIWIKEYKNLKNIGFNLSGEDYFSYDGKNLTSRKKENYIDSFFDSKGNINVTAIIGENGTGKTNFFRFLSQLASKIFEPEAIIIFKYSRKLYIYNHKDIKVIFDEKKLEKTNIILYDKNTNRENFKLPSTLLDRNKFVYISNILNPDFKNNFDDINFGVFLKVYSKNSLLTKDIDYFNYINKNKNDLKFSDAFSYHNVMEFFRQKNLIDFNISNELKNILDFNLPNSLACSTNTFYEDYLLHICKNKKELINFEKLSKTLIEGVEKLKNKYKEKDSIKMQKKQYGENTVNIFKIDIFKCILFVSLFNLCTLFNSKKDIFIDEKFYNFSYDDVPNTIIFFDEIFEAIMYYQINLFDKHENNQNIEYFRKYKDLIDYLFKHIDNDKNLFEHNKEMYIIFHREDFVTFFEKIELIYHKDAFMNIQWFNSDNNSFNFLSNGENNILTILSRLYQASVEVKDYDYMYIMIDEGDLGLHPKWQKKFLRICLEISKKIFKIDRKKFHFIFSSHSPFLLSDLPNYNVILLENIDEKVEVKQSNDLTFAGNIHTLYSKSFFIDEILIGDFAKEKIDSEVIENLFINPSKDIDDNKKERIKNIINLISEPILRNRFLDKFREVYND